nr:MAG TPA: hypothetical protein [Caudoviricetes sp.]
MKKFIKEIVLKIQVWLDEREYNKEFKRVN